MIKNIVLSLSVIFLSGTLFSVLGQYYYFDTGSSYPYQQGCPETINIKINTEADPVGARAGLLRLSLDPVHFSYSTSPTSSVLRTNLFIASAATFADWTATSSPSWQGSTTVLQIDRKNNTTNYKGNGGLYGSVLLTPLYNQIPYTGYISMLYDGDTVKTSLSSLGVNIINPTSQNSRLTGYIKVLQEPCSADTNSPNISISTPVNGLTKQFYVSGMVFSMSDNSSVGSVPYVRTGGGIWTGNVWGITNQYGIDISTFTMSVSGNGDSRTFLGNQFDTGNSSASKYAGPSGKTWQFLDKNYNLNIASGELFDYGIEKAITVTASVRDRKNNLYTLGSFVFNSPVGPVSLGSFSPANGAAFVDPNSPIKFGVQDDWAGVNSGSIKVTLQGINGTTYGPYIFTGSTLNLSGVSSSANQPNYYVNVSSHSPLPSSGTIQVIIYAEDMEGAVDTISNYSFTTRPSCAQLGCCNQISIQTGYSSLPFLYDNSTVYISGGNNPTFSTGLDGTGYLDCNASWSGIPIYSGVSGSSQYMTFLGSNLLTISGASNVKIVLDGNIIRLSTIFVPIVIPPSGGGGGGGGTTILIADDCELPSKLPGANVEGIDYSPSFYDEDCGSIEDGQHGAADICPVDYDDSNYSMEIVDAYQFSYGVGITDICPIQDAGIRSKLVRKDLVRMLVYFSVKVLGISPDEQKRGCDVYGDLIDGSEDAAYAKLGCQLEVMGMQYDGVTPLKNFMPENSVSRAQFGTTLSRVIFGRKYNGNVPYWFSKHLGGLKEYGIMNKIDDPYMIEVKGYVMLMFKRAYDSGLVEQFRLAAAAKNGALALK